MRIVTATSISDEVGPLTRVVYAFVAAQRKIIASGLNSPSDWEPLSEFIAADEFKRVGAYLEELDWPEFKKFLAGWLQGGTRFEMTEFHISEIGNAVFQEIEERHYRGDEFIRKNVLAVYRFNNRNRIVHLDIYEQAKDSGRWIIEAARAAAP